MKYLPYQLSRAALCRSLRTGGVNFFVIVSLLVGLSLNFFEVSPIKALLYTAIVYGLTAPVLIAVNMHNGIIKDEAVIADIINLIA